MPDLAQRRRRVERRYTEHFIHGIGESSAESEAGHVTSTRLLASLVHVPTRHVPQEDTPFLHGLLQRVSCLDVANTGVSHGPGGNVGRCLGRGDVLALELAKDAGVGAAHGAGGSESVKLARTAKVGLAEFVGVGVGGAEQGALVGRLNHGVDVLENVTLSQDIATLANLESVALNVVEEVVNLSKFLVGFRFP